MSQKEYFTSFQNKNKVVWRRKNFKKRIQLGEWQNSRYISGRCFFQCCGSGSRIRLLSIPGLIFFHPGSRILSRGLKNFFKPQKCLFLSARKYDPGFSSRIRIRIFTPGSRGQKGTTSLIRKGCKIFRPGHIKRNVFHQKSKLKTF